MRTPLTYYGGKQRLASTIIDLIPPHKIYCEPFIGGGAVFFQKPPSSVEVINDINQELVNFYEVIKRDFTALAQKVEISLHSRDLHRHATVIFQNPDMFDQVKRAWAVWVLANVSFGGRLNGSFGYALSSSHSVKIRNKRNAFTPDLAIRLQDVQIECADALRIIRSRDTPTSFFYLDPPYIGTDQGHYDGYSIEDYQKLLDMLSSIEGKFLLSAYPSEILSRYVRRNRWHQKAIQVALCAAKDRKGKRRTELLVANYLFPPETGGASHRARITAV